MSANGYEVTGLRTGAEKLVAHRTGSTQAVSAPESGKVLEIDEFGVTVELNTKPKTTKSYPIGKTFGKHEGGVYPHNLVANIKAGQKFEKGHILTYNDKFFEPDIATPDQVNWKAGVMANVVLLEGTDTLEDSSAISQELSDKLTTQVTEVRNITVNFDQAVHDLVKEGAKLTPESVLCVIEDAVSAGMSGYSEKSIETLRKLASKAPRAKLSGTVDRIEVFYHGDEEDMSESVRSLVNWGDRKRRRESKRSTVKTADNGRVDSSLRIDGNPVELETMIIRLYLTREVGAVGGDKAVFANQLKSTFRRVMVGVNKTADGLPIDAIFGRVSVDARIVLSVYKIGTTNKICQLISEGARAIYKKGG